MDKQRNHTSTLRFARMSLTISRPAELKIQPWKEFFPAGDTSALTESLYGNSEPVGAVERRWMQEEDVAEDGIATNGDHRPVQSDRIATSGASFGHSLQSNRIATSGANFGHSLHSNRIATSGASLGHSTY